MSATSVMLLLERGHAACSSVRVSRGIGVTIGAGENSSWCVAATGLLGFHVELGWRDGRFAILRVHDGAQVRLNGQHATGHQDLLDGDIVDLGEARIRVGFVQSEDDRLPDSITKLSMEPVGAIDTTRLEFGRKEPKLATRSETMAPSTDPPTRLALDPELVQLAASLAAPKAIASRVFLPPTADPPSLSRVPTQLVPLAQAKARYDQVVTARQNAVVESKSATNTFAPEEPIVTPKRRWPVLAVLLLGMSLTAAGAATLRNMRATNVTAPARRSGPKKPPSPQATDKPPSSLVAKSGDELPARAHSHQETELAAHDAGVPAPSQQQERASFVASGSGDSTGVDARVFTAMAKLERRAVDMLIANDVRAAQAAYAQLEVLAPTQSSYRWMGKLLRSKRSACAGAKPCDQ